ncbi:ATP-binding protein [Streptomyces sp. DSM 15324]|uniref:ATP-binding protein n=1 Tax=Streptomyces sp. DSM 15324 TaxID=1739111 RepID=UPI002D21A4C2|nr:ATP-binding protein [Streptomyces sp. DSM 15324]
MQPQPHDVNHQSRPHPGAATLKELNKGFGKWSEVFGDEVVLGAMIGRLVHRTEVVATKGTSYRLKEKDLGRVPAAAEPAE